MLTADDKKFIIEAIKSSSRELAKEIGVLFSITNQGIDKVDNKLDILAIKQNEKIVTMNHRLTKVEEKIFTTTTFS